MGRGRAKAKQQKVARELKYNSHFTDLDALQRELGTSDPGSRARVDDTRDDGSSGDPAEDDYEGWTSTGR